LNASCVQCGQSLRDGVAHWATWQELIELNWPAEESGKGAAGEVGPFKRDASQETPRHGGRAGPQAEG
jgi:hypothetical protein